MKILFYFGLLNLMPFWMTIPTLGETRMIPHVTRLGGGFSTSILIRNDSMQAQTCTFTSFDSTGTRLGDVNLTVPGNLVVSYAPEDLFESPDRVSHFLINSTPAEIVVSVAYQVASGRGSPAHLIETSSQRRKWKILPGNWDSVFDGVAFVNMGNNQAEVTISQID